jgi:hypothetical protein
MTADGNSNAPARALIDDALQRLGKARLSLDLARDLLTQGNTELTTIGGRIASVAAELRGLLPPPIDQDDAELGMAWWNSLSERERAKALAAAGWKAGASFTPSAAEAWAHWKRARGVAPVECECGNRYGFTCPVHGAPGVQP